MVKIFQKYEKKLRIAQEGVITRNVTKTREHDVIVDTFPGPTILKQDKTLRWVIKTEPDENNNFFQYTVKYTPYRGKRPEIPERIYRRKRSIVPRRDSYIAYCDSMMQSEKPQKETISSYLEKTVPEYTEEQLREMDDYKPFFKNWDNGVYAEDDCEEIMLQAINGRIEVYQEFYKETANQEFLAKAVFIKSLKLNRLSNLHKFYLILSEECCFPMFYVEGILRRHYQ